MLTRRRKEGSYGYVIQIQGSIQLRHKIGTYPNIEVGIDVTDKSPFLLDHIMLGKKTRKS